MDFQFQTATYATLAEMLADIAQCQLYAESNEEVNEDTQRAYLAAQTDTELADGAIEAWGLDIPLTAGDTAHMARYGYTAEDLAAQFAAIRARVLPGQAQS